MAEWYLHAGGTQYGPIPREELEDWIKDGRVSNDDLVFGPGLDEWTRLGDLPEFGTAPPTIPCRDHPGRVATAVCSSCGADLCEDCAAVIHSSVLCARCLEGGEGRRAIETAAAREKALEYGRKAAPLAGFILFVLFFVPVAVEPVTESSGGGVIWAWDLLSRALTLPVPRAIIPILILVSPLAVGPGAIISARYLERRLRAPVLLLLGTAPLALASLGGILPLYPAGTALSAFPPGPVGRLSLLLLVILLALNRLRTRFNRTRLALIIPLPALILLRLHLPAVMIRPDTFGVFAAILSLLSLLSLIPGRAGAGIAWVGLSAAGLMVVFLAASILVPSLLGDLPDAGLVTRLKVLFILAGFSLLSYIGLTDCLMQAAARSGQRLSGRRGPVTITA